MKRSGAVLLTAIALTSCVSVPRDAGVSEIQQSIAQRGAPPVEWRAEPATSDHEGVAAMLTDDLTADEAVAIAVINNPHLQVSLAELGIARALAGRWHMDGETRLPFRGDRIHAVADHVRRGHR